MMNGFPTLYKDELFFSIVARYKRANAIIDKSALFKDICNTYERQIFMFMPIHLKELIANLPTTSKITESEIILNHTLYPVFTAFLSSERAKTIYEQMINGTRKNLLIESGVNASKVRLYNKLRLCRLCVEESLKNKGEGYWRRLHQVPGVLFCRKHNAPLYESEIPANNTVKDFICIEDITEDGICENPDDYNLPKFYELNKNYIESVEYLLKNDVLRRPNDFIIDIYIDRLIDKKLASQNGTIFMKDLQREFGNYYTQEYLKIMQSDYDMDAETNWLKVFIRKDGKNKSVLRHILLIEFLGLDIKEFVSLKDIKKRMVMYVPNIPRLDIDVKKQQWIKIIEENPGLSRRALANINKGIYSYIYKYEKEWYHSVTPIHVKNKSKDDRIDWQKRDEECLDKVKVSVELLMNKPGIPVKLTRFTIRRKSGIPAYFRSEKLVRTHEYISSIIDDMESFRRKKIKWAIEDMCNRGISLSVYKVHLYAGFGEVKNEHIRQLISDMLQQK